MFQNEILVVGLEQLKQTIKELEKNVHRNIRTFLAKFRLTNAYIRNACTREQGMCMELT